MTILLDFLIAFVVIEIAAVAWRRYRRGEIGAFPNDLAHLGSGFFLMLAVRLAWTQESALLVIVLVTLAGVVHAFDMIRRFRAEG
jgi:hypothetical protein